MILNRHSSIESLIKQYTYSFRLVIGNRKYVYDSTSVFTDLNNPLKNSTLDCQPFSVSLDFLQQPSTPTSLSNIQKLSPSTYQSICRVLHYLDLKDFNDRPLLMPSNKSFKSPNLPQSPSYWLSRSPIYQK